MRDDFCVFILTHGRPDRVKTYDTIRKAGYTGRVYIVIDDEDPSEGEYRARYGDEVLQFCKSEVAAATDDGDNTQDRRSVIYARNKCWVLASQVSVRFFMVLDDDYTGFEYRRDSSNAYCTVRVCETLDGLFNSLVAVLEATGALSVAMSQGGDWIGGITSGCMDQTAMRKCMNTFVCATDRPFKFFGKLNDDVNTYVTLGRRGDLFFTATQPKVVQATTQESSGGLTTIYLDVGTYVKSFYSVMYAPSCVKVSVLQDHAGNNPRIHHKLNWHKIAPKIIREEHRMTRKEPIA